MTTSEPESKEILFKFCFILTSQDLNITNKQIKQELVLICNKMTDTVNRMAYWNKILASARPGSTLAHALLLLFCTRKIWFTPCNILCPDVTLPAQGTLAKSVSLKAWGSRTAGLPRRGQRKEIENETEEKEVIFCYSPNQKARCMPTETSACPLCSSRYLVQLQRPWRSKPGARLVRVDLGPFPNTFKPNNFEKNKGSILLTLKVDRTTGWFGLGGTLKAI